MNKEAKTAVYDDELRIEAYFFEGIAQPFPNHFHEYYVIGFVEGGERVLFCKNREYHIQTDDILLFNPGDSHACAQSGAGTLHYRGLNIAKDVMVDLVSEVTGQADLPNFSQSVVQDEEVVCYLRPLHDLIMNGSSEFRKEENLLLMLSLLIQRYAQSFEHEAPEHSNAIETACAFMETHYAQHICLEEICCEAGLSRSSLLRAFTKAKGVTPYRYLENVRIGKAKKLLEQGHPPLEVALHTGFSDQSHFTNYFSRFIGLSPGAYREIFVNRTAEEKISEP